LPARPRFRFPWPRPWASCAARRCLTATPDFNRADHLDVASGGPPSKMAA
jgi:hypothetical protein